MIERRLFTNALVTMLTAATTFPVGRGRMPATASKPPYYILDSLPATVFGAPFADDNEDASLVYQLTSVSGPDPAKPNSYGTQDQIELLADRARTAVLGRDPNTGLWLHDITVPGIKVMCRELDTEPGGTNDPGDVTMSYIQRFKFDLTPA